MKVEKFGVLVLSKGVHIGQELSLSYGRQYWAKRKCTRVMGRNAITPAVVAAAAPPASAAFALPRLTTAAV